MNSSNALRLATAGIGSIATGFGMGRYGYGLLLPDIQHSYGLSTGVLGAGAAASYAAYLAATAFAGLWAERLGARETVAVGGTLATLGMLVAGVSSDAVVLIAGVAIAGGSCGLLYPPFADAVATLPAPRRGRTLSAISCGTGYGVTIAAPLAIAAGANWRVAWLLFATCALAATAWSWRVLNDDAPRQVPSRSASRRSGLHLPPRAAWTLMTAGFLIGAGSAAYWTFAVADLRAHGLPSTLSRIFLAVVGIASLLSTLTGDLVHRWGPRAVFRSMVITESASVALLALAPSSLIAAIASAIAFGACFNAVVVVLALWSSRVYPDQLSRGLAVAMASMGVGQLCGPLASGLLGQHLGLTDVLLIGTLIVLAAILSSPPSQDRSPTGQPGR